MKHFLFSLMMLMVSLSFGQSPINIINSHGTSEVSTSQVSFANPWVGSTLAFNVDEDRPLNESVLFTASILQIVAGGDGWAVPVVGEVGLGSNDVLTPGSGLNLGVYPYYRLTNGEGAFQVYAHGGLAYKVITEGVEAGVDAPQQIRALVGVEVMFNSPESKGPTTLSVTPVYMFNSNSGLDNTGGLEVSFVLPVGPGLGLFAEGLVPFKSEDFSSGLRLGVIVNGRL